MGAAAGIGALVGAGMGMLKSQEDKQKSQRESALAIAQTKAAPLFSFQTKQAIQPGEIQQYPTQFDRVSQGAISGAQMGSQFGGGAGALGGGAGGDGGAGMSMAGDQASWQQEANANQSLYSSQSAAPWQQEANANQSQYAKTPGWNPYARR